MITKFDNTMQAEETIKLGNAIENLANMKIINRKLRRPMFGGTTSWYSKWASCIWHLILCWGYSEKKKVVTSTNDDVDNLIVNVGCPQLGATDKSSTT